jgi:hypothetical protein
MTKAEEMRRLTEKANQQRALTKKDEELAAEAARLKAERSKRLWWGAHGVPEMLWKIRQAAERGTSFYTEIFDDCPDYVVKYIRDRGFEAELSDGQLRWNDNDACDYYTRVLTVRW